MIRLIRKLKTGSSFASGMRYFEFSIWELLVVIAHVLKYRIEFWHVTQLASATDYQKFIINKVNTLPYKLNILDIGSGLGLISRKIKFSQYLGIDSDAKVVACALRLSGKSNINFAYGDANNVKISDDFDANVILALNFLHHFNEEFIVEFATMLSKKFPKATFIFDYNVGVNKVEIITRRLLNLGFKMEVFPNEEFRGRVIFSITFDND